MNITGWIIVAIVVVILLIDLVLYIKNKKTFTQQTILWSKSYPIIPFLWGFLMGHFFG